MKMKTRLEKIEQAIEQMEQSGRPRFRVFLAGDKPLPPQKGTLDIYFNLPKPKPVPPGLMEEKQCEAG
jgi:hypothetical protein